MLNARLFTGVVLGVVALLAIFIFPQEIFSALVGVFILLAGWEWAGLMGWKTLGKVFYLWIMVVLSVLSLYAPMGVIYAALVWWVVAIILVLCGLQRSTWVARKPILFFIGLLVLVPCWVAAWVLHAQDRLLLFYVFMITALSDTAAYYSGKTWGKRALAPLLSPKKTVEGLLGGLVVAGVASIIIAYFVPQLDSFAKQFYMLVFGILIILVGVFGDLFEILIKRQVNVKDSGSLLPGHGGVLDRVDSLCATLPVFTAIALLVGLLK